MQHWMEHNAALLRELFVFFSLYHIPVLSHHAQLNASATYLLSYVHRNVLKKSDELQLYTDHLKFTCTIERKPDNSRIHSNIQMLNSITSGLSSNFFSTFYKCTFYFQPNSFTVLIHSLSLFSSLSLVLHYLLHKLPANHDNN